MIMVLSIGVMGLVVAVQGAALFLLCRTLVRSQKSQSELSRSLMATLMAYHSAQPAIQAVTARSLATPAPPTVARPVPQPRAGGQGPTVSQEKGGAVFQGTLE